MRRRRPFNSPSSPSRPWPPRPGAPPLVFYHWVIFALISAKFFDCQGISSPVLMFSRCFLDILKMLYFESLDLSKFYMDFSILLQRFVKIDTCISLRCFLGRSAGRRRQYIGLQGDYWKGICAAFTNFANFSSDRLCGKISISFPILSLR